MTKNNNKITKINYIDHLYFCTELLSKLEFNLLNRSIVLIILRLRVKFNFTRDLVEIC